MYDCSGGNLLPSTLQQTDALYYSEQKKHNSYQCFYFLLISPGSRGERNKQKNPPKTWQRTGKCFQVIVCFIPGLSLSVIQECQGTYPNTGSLLQGGHSLTSPSAAGSIWSLPLLPAAVHSLGPAGSLGLCSAAASPQPGSSPTRLPQVFQTGFVPQFLFRAMWEVGTTNPAVWIYILVLLHTVSVVSWRFYHIFCYWLSHSIMCASWKWT